MNFRELEVQAHINFARVRIVMVHAGLGSWVGDGALPVGRDPLRYTQHGAAHMVKVRKPVAWISDLVC